jgi:hypothetical protein
VLTVLAMHSPGVSCTPSDPVSHKTINMHPAGRHKWLHPAALCSQGRAAQGGAAAAEAWWVQEKPSQQSSWHPLMFTVDEHIK